MLHFNKIDASTFLVVLLTCVLSLVAACVQPSGPLGAPNVVQVGAVSSVRITLVQSTLAPGQTTQGTVVATSAAGDLITGKTVTWASVSPTVATVSSTGAVTAVASGSVTIQATVSGKAGSASLTVTQVPESTWPVFHDFNNGTPGPFRYLGSDVTSIDYPADPTNTGRGKVNRIRYHPSAGLNSNDINMELNTTHRYRYGETIWFKGDLYIPSTLSDGVTQKTASQNLDTRKLIDYFSAPPLPRLILERTNGLLKYFVCQIEDDGQFHTDVTWGSTGITLLDNTWYTIEVRFTLNSADGVKDGVLDVYINNPGAVPNFRLSSGISPITEKNGGSYFNSFRYGTQTTTYSGEAGYSEYRYWDNVGFSTTRVGQ
ncbi:MAG: Ig-like domain-containing protein [Anaerolineae bacterium]|nr:Ig-like domain-containing protein [Gemmatimonadaceae bacterium]